MKTVYKAQLLQKRKWRIRKKVTGTAARPRLSVKFSGKHIYAQAVERRRGCDPRVPFDARSRGSARARRRATCRGAKALGSAFAAKAKAAGLTAVVFDRNGRLFHGRVKTFADAAREGGLQF